MKRIYRDRRLTPEEAEKYAKAREEIEKELPDLIKRHQERMKHGTKSAHKGRDR